MKLRREIEANSKANIEAIDQLLQGLPAKEKLENNLAAVIAENIPQRRSSEIIEKVIKSSSSDFNIDTVLHWYRKAGGTVTLHTPRIISQVINMLKQREPSEIEVMAAGKGRRSGIYKYKPVK